jgi:adhesin/invasin
VNFSDGCKVLGSTSCGTFTPASAITNSTGHASTTYTLPKKAGSYTITVSGTGFSSTTATATAKVGPATAILANGGTKQTGPAGSTLPNPMVVKAQDMYKNGVAGITINFTANNGGVLSTTSAVTDSNGNARTWLTLPNTVGTVTVNATSPGFTNKLTFLEYSN